MTLEKLEKIFKNIFPYHELDMEALNNFKTLFGTKIINDSITKDFLKKYHAECQECGITWKPKNNEQTQFCSATCMEKYFEKQLEKLSDLQDQLDEEREKICRSKLKYNKLSHCLGCGKFCNTSHGFCNKKCFAI